jgi:anti-sigma-K factor RskA
VLPDDSDQSHESQRWSQSNPRLLWLVAPVVVALVVLLMVALAALLAPQQTGQAPIGPRAGTTCGSSCP